MCIWYLYLQGISQIDESLLFRVGPVSLTHPLTSERKSTLLDHIKPTEGLVFNFCSVQCGMLLQM
jgi:hypothetical protein